MPKYLIALTSLFLLTNVTKVFAHNNIPEMLDDYTAVEAALSGDDGATAQAKTKELNLEVQDWLGDHAATDPNYKNIQALQTGVTSLLGASATDLDTIRKAFIQVSNPLVEVVRADAQLKTQYQLYYCPMVKQYWFQPIADKLQNPYLGSQMLTCGSKKPW